MRFKRPPCHTTHASRALSLRRIVAKLGVVASQHPDEYGHLAECADILRKLDPSRAQAFDDRLRRFTGPRLLRLFDQDSRSAMRDDLYDALRAHTPYGAYFGTPTPTSTIVGFWPAEWREQSAAVSESRARSMGPCFVL